MTQPWNPGLPEEGPSLTQVPYLAQQPAHLQPAALAPVVATGLPDLEPTDTELWSLVAELRGQVADAMKDDGHMDLADREQLGRARIQAVLNEYQESLVAQHKPPLGPKTEHALAVGLYDAIFRLGRLQPLVDLPGATDIELYGADRVHVRFANGRHRWLGPVFSSDAEMIEAIQLLAGQDPQAERVFTPTHPHLNMALPGRMRLAAVGFSATSQPRVTIRLQHLKNVDLRMLAQQGEIDTVLGQLLTAAVLARKSIIVSGQGQGSGKTTFLRALAAAIPADESVATVEDTYELWLHDDPTRHPRVLAQQSFAGAGENDATGRPTGRVTTGDLLTEALRHNIDRLIVGEVRTPEELLSMFTAMQAGNGSMSTVHADSAHDVIERLVGLAVRDASVGETYAYRQIAATIDLIVFLGVHVNPDGSKTRYVREVVEPSRGEGTTPVATTDVFVPGPDGRAVPNIPPSFMADLVAVGLDPGIMHNGDTWRHQ